MCFSVPITCSPLALVVSDRAATWALWRLFVIVGPNGRSLKKMIFMWNWRPNTYDEIYVTSTYITRRSWALNYTFPTNINSHWISSIRIQSSNLRTMRFFITVILLIFAITVVANPLENRDGCKDHGPCDSALECCSRYCYEYVRPRAIFFQNKPQGTTDPISFARVATDN